MIYRIGSHLITPLGEGASHNVDLLLEGKSMLSAHADMFGLPEECMVSVFPRDITDEIGNDPKGKDQYSFFERLCIYSAGKAIRDAGIDPTDARTVFILSSTKGNVEYLADDLDDPRCYIAGSADRIARYFGNSNRPIVASNACISGVCGQIAAVRALLANRYDRAIVIGCDVLSRFIISGFQSFKALSPEECRPYDRDRKGLNLGEAVATLILERGHDWEGKWVYASSSIHNDANHISGPSRTGEGSWRVLRDMLADVGADELAFVNTHGTATAYNDEMESIAIHRADLDSVPVNGLKGYYGHTLGAAGVLETLLSMEAVDRGIVLPTRGFESQGTSYRVDVDNNPRVTDKKAFFKILSGFGGSNAGIAYRKEVAE